MKRREVITLLGGAAAAWPLAARAQQSASPVIGFLGSETPELFAGRMRAFRQGLDETGYVEGRNVTVEYRWALGQSDRLPALAADLVPRRVSVIVTPGESAALVAKAATTVIPIVFRIAGDPVALRLVARLNRPGGNVTGVTGLNVEIGSKRLQVLHELIPAATNIALLVNPTNPSVADANVRDLKLAASRLGLKVHVVRASSEGEFDTAFAALSEARAQALVIGNDIFFATRSKQLAALSARYAVPTISAYRAFAEAGDLVSYGVDIADQYRLAGIYTGRVLHGENPSDMPVQQPTKFEMVINLKTAKTLGLEVPPTLLALADEVIE
jgi:putative tryptophan/tyrosine transport system substrate-binding protein